MTDVPCRSIGCGACCRHHHLVVVHPELGDEVERYETQSLPPIKNDPEGALALKWKANGDCIHFDENTGCMVHDYKPTHCTIFDCRKLIAGTNRNQRRLLIRERKLDREVSKAAAKLLRL